MDALSRRCLLRSSGLAVGAIALGGVSPAFAVDALGTARALESSAEVLMLARVWVDRGNSHLIGDFDDTHNVFDDGSVELLLWPGDLGRLAATGLRYEVTVSDLVARDTALAASAPPRSASLAPQPGETADGAYRTLAQHNADMARLASENPAICEMFELPFTTLQGRTVFGLEIAEEVARKDGRPVYYNDGVHHAREWPAAEMPIMWAFDLIESYNRVAAGGELQAQDLRMANIVRNARNIIIPVVNADGFDYSRTGPAGTGRDVADTNLTGLVPGASMQYWRKNMRGARVQPTAPTLNPGVESMIPNNGVVPTTPGALGVDNNRNYAYRWGGDGSSASINSETYRGNEPFSEPESRNVQFIHQTRQCVSGITHHTSGNLVLWAWGDTHEDAPDDALLARLGFACGDYNGYRPTKSIDLYVTTGTCSDYTYGAFGSISYTFEHAGSSFHPVYTSVVPQFYAANRESLMMMCELVCLEPEQRGFLHAAVANYRDAGGQNTVQLHLQGDFAETISGTDYSYPASNALDLSARHNCVITGRLVDTAGNGVAGQVELTKGFVNALSEGNPVSRADWPEIMDAVIDTASDGTFRWVVYPSTQPFVEFKGGQQTITITGVRDGSIGGFQEVFLTRGDVKDLGDILV